MGDGNGVGAWPFEIVPSGDLVGREEVIDDIVDQLLKSGRSVLLAAPRRQGKSSVAREALRRLDAEGCLVASIDFFQLTTKRTIADALVRQLLESSTSLKSKVRRLTRAARSLPAPLPTFKAGEFEVGVSINQGQELTDDQAFQQAMELPERLAVQEGRTCIVLLDEFQEAGKTLGPQIYGVMRSYFQAQPHTKQIFAGSQQSLLRELFAGPARAFLRYAREVPLPDVPATAWTPYIRRKFDELDIACSESLARRIVETTGGHPADTMELCDQLYTAARKAASNILDEQLLDVAIVQTDRVLRWAFDQVWEELGEAAYSRIALQRIVFGLPISTGLRSSQAQRALARLVDRGLVVRQGRGRWHCKERLLERYVRLTKPLHEATSWS